MSARLLLAVFDTIYLIALCAWVGSVLFLSFGVAPIIFKVLDSTAAARFVRSLFPRYYAWGAITGAIALAACVAGPLCVPELRGARVGVSAAMIMAGILIMLYCGNSLVPAINAARDVGPLGEKQFNLLHRLSVRLNSVVLIIGLALLLAFATRPAPRTEGIIELGPQERAERDADRFERAQRKYLEEHQKGLPPGASTRGGAEAAPNHPAAGRTAPEHGGTLPAAQPARSAPGRS